MCGITGWANLDSHTPPPDGANDLLHAMCERMIHRGPDSEGLLVTNGVALGMRRLAIIDLVTGEQPVFNEDKSIAAVLNGELYNYRELRKDLERQGHSFRSASDTEILPHLYEESGEAMVEPINGMFAFALWDAKRRRLFIARDRFGEKPLYWGVFDNTLLFASEPKVLLAHPDVKTSLNLQALRQYLSFDYVPAPLSIYEGITGDFATKHFNPLRVNKKRLNIFRNSWLTPCACDLSRTYHSASCSQVELIPPPLPH